ncbi:hypothetical protein CHELA40_12833 [Chelatococcus asaccharovorans]|nr:hypothetical protein CHELA40_12833 [Chelatococcus asaccharovorans]CAH1681515.1 hypothetical protein CHELA17_62786 [Chelatococcus asaccharovorans]
MQASIGFSKYLSGTEYLEELATGNALKGTRIGSRSRHSSLQRSRCSALSGAASTRPAVFLMTSRATFA